MRKIYDDYSSHSTHSSSDEVGMHFFACNPSLSNAKSLCAVRRASSPPSDVCGLVCADFSSRVVGMVWWGAGEVSLCMRCAIFALLCLRFAPCGVVARWHDASLHALAAQRLVRAQQRNGDTTNEHNYILVDDGGTVCALQCVLWCSLFA